MERIMKAQALGQQGANKGYIPKKILEINPNHPIVKELLRLVKGGETESAKVTASVLYETALLSSGYTVDDPAAFAKSIHKMMSLNLNLEDTEVSEEPTTPERAVPEEPSATDEKDELWQNLANK